MNSSELIYSGIPTLFRDKSEKISTFTQTASTVITFCLLSRFNKFFRFSRKFFAKYQVLLKADSRSEFILVYLSFLNQKKNIISLPLLALWQSFLRKNYSLCYLDFVYVEINFSLVYKSANNDF